MTDPLASQTSAEKAAPAWDFRDEAYLAEAAPLPGYRPGGLMGICVIAIVLGALGLLTGLSSVVMSLVGNQVQQLQTQWGTAGAPPGMRDVQAEMNAKTMEIVNRFRLINLVLGVVHLGLAAALLTGGVRSLKMREAGRRLLWIACGVAIVFELTRAVPQLLMQLENMALMEDYLPRLMEASAPGAQGEKIAAFGKMMARFSLIVGWVVFFGWLLLKLVYFGIAFHYLGRPRTKALYKA